MKETIEYQVISDNDFAVFQQLVNSAMKDGWYCVGGLSAVSVITGYRYFQAMNKLVRSPM